MKTINKLFLGLGLLGVGGLYSCSDFDEVNTDPSKTSAESAKAYWSLNKSIGKIQMDPSTGERVYVYNWAEAARMITEKKHLSIGNYDDDYISSFYYPCISDAITAANLAITLTDIPQESAADTKIYPNIKQFARIWRAYLLAQFADSFGPAPLGQDLEKGELPVYESERDVYKYILTELKEAVAAIDLSVEPSADQANCDPFFGYKALNWVKYGNSLRMRMAMRLSNLEGDSEIITMAKEAFNDAAKDLSKTISADADIMEIIQNNGWDDYTGPYTRTFNDQCLSSTLANIMTNLGGVAVTAQRADLASYVKSANYLGLQYSDHFVQNTDNPTKDYWMDGLPENIDPRGLKLYFLSGDENADNMLDVSQKYKEYGFINPENTKDTIKVDGRYSWNGVPTGTSSSYSDAVTFNELFASSSARLASYPILGAQAKNATEKMVYFGAWETYFLIAEAYVRGWITNPIAEVPSAEAAYNKGILMSFEHFGVSAHYNDYIASTDYNRVGTSVNFNHTTEATAETMYYCDGYENGYYNRDLSKKPARQIAVSYNYPQGSKTFAEGGLLNSQLAKIITQKYIANLPYLVQECWSDFRRTGLPFMEIPANEKIMTATDMTEQYWAPDDYKTGQKWSHYPQRLRYPTTLNNSSPEEYQHALEMLGGANTVMTPLWWSRAAALQKSNK